MEGGDATFGGADEEFAIERGVEGRGFEEVWESPGNVVAVAGVEAAEALVRGELDADAVPFPFDGEVGGGDERRVQVVRLHALGLAEQWVGEHGRAEGGEGAGDRLGSLAFEPREKIEIGRGHAVPEFLDLGDVDLAEVCDGLTGEAGGDTDAKAAGDELEQRPATSGVERVQPAFDELQALRLGGLEKGFNDFSEIGRAVGAGASRPDQGDGLG